MGNGRPAPVAITPNESHLHYLEHLLGDRCDEIELLLDTYEDRDERQAYLDELETCKKLLGWVRATLRVVEE